ncbi:hypothetical protein KQI63_09475 [bacterium]|nr:hypothetical protein [bacterium]
MWTWIKTEFRYHKGHLVGGAIASILIPLLSIPILRLFEANSYAQRSVMLYFVIGVVVSWNWLVYGIRKSLRFENRALILAHGVSLRGLAGGRILMNVLPSLDIGLALLLLGWLAGFAGVSISLPGLLVFLSMFLVTALYWLIVDHFADVSQEYLKVMGLSIPIMIPFFWYLNLFLFDSFKASTPLFSELASWPVVLVLLGLGAVICTALLRLSGTRWALRPFVANKGVSIG